MAGERGGLPGHWAVLQSPDPHIRDHYLADLHLLHYARLSDTVINSDRPYG